MLQFVVICDVCGCHEGHIEASKSKAWALAKRDGWTKGQRRSGNEHICWTCAGGMANSKQAYHDLKTARQKVRR